METLQNTLSQAQNTLSNATQNISNTVQSTKDSVSGSMDQLSSAAAVGGNSEFLSSNGVVGKFFFIIFALIAFMILFRLGVMVIGYFFQPSGSPYIVKGMLNGNAPVTITASPDDKFGVKIVRSNNRETGIEFTWSCWLNVYSVNPNATAKWQNIFNKGNNTYKTTSDYMPAGTGTGIATVNNGPGLYVSNKDNRIVFVMDVIGETGATNVKNIAIENIPIGKWFHLSLRLQNKVLDAYVNGVIYNRTTFTQIPKQNNDNIQLFQNDGFPGQISNLRYFDSALSVFQINSIVSYGPNLTSANTANQYSGSYDYLSTAWYTQ
jgi:hypothetical protein